jgi:hypothetical protein
MQGFRCGDGAVPHPSGLARKGADPTGPPCMLRGHNRSALVTTVASVGGMKYVRKTRASGALNRPLVNGVCLRPEAWADPAADTGHCERSPGIFPTVRVPRFSRPTALPALLRTKETRIQNEGTDVQNRQGSGNLFPRSGPVFPSSSSRAFLSVSARCRSVLVREVRSCVAVRSPSALSSASSSGSLGRRTPWADGTT